MSSPPKVLVVGGPTASGKSALGIALARSLCGEVINVDSVQVYRGLDIGSAKLTVAEQEGIPHHLLDIFDPSEPANVATFRARARAAIDDVRSRGRLPILVGGSGMYLTALLHGLAQVPPSDEETRSRVAKMSPEEMYRALQEADPETAARLNPRDVQRVSRALEILFATGERPSDIFERHKFSSSELLALVLVICRSREELYERINRRSELMVERGLLDETRKLLLRHGDSPVLQTLGYKQAREVLIGELENEQLASEISLYTRRYAKRQMTYWRNEPAKRGWRVLPGPTEGEVVAGFDSFPERVQKKMVGFRALLVTAPELSRLVSVRMAESLETTEMWYLKLNG